MPYISQIRRDELDPVQYLYFRPTHAGELNYVISQLLIQYVKDRGLSYQTINDVEGVLAQAARRFDERVAVPYEDDKIRQNGDLDWPT